MKAQTTPTYTVDIFMAGDIAQAKQILRGYCYEFGFCVHLHPVDYIYTGGEETGFKVGIVNYPRFPSEPVDLWHKAQFIAERLIEGLHQHSALLVSQSHTCWLTRREEDQRTKGPAQKGEAE